MDKDISAVSRRGFIARLLSGVAVLPGVTFGFPKVALADIGCGAGPGLSITVGRAGDRCLQLLVEDRQIDSLPRMTVPPGATVDWAPDPDDRFGGQGRLDGVAGNFSGRDHLTASQLFLPWPSVSGTRPDLFAPAGVNAVGTLFADDPAKWQVLIDGRQVPVEKVYRKSVPIRTVRTTPLVHVHDQRHLVSLMLGTLISEGARVEIIATGLTVDAVIIGPDQLCEAVHVCHVGYPVTGSKKAYVGLWLGVDREGNPGNTDTFLSERTNWRLVDAIGGATVANGVLKRIKRSDEAHFDDLNFNGCDIYQADFSAVSQEGEFRVEVEGLGSSVPFEIALAPYDEVLRLAARWYFHQRSGCEITADHGEGRTRPRNGHPDDGLKVWQTKVLLGRTSEGFQSEPAASELMGRQPREIENPDAWGGWHDAGDWDRRIQHTDAVYEMALIIEMFKTARGLQLNLPESGRPYADPAVKSRKGPNDQGDGATVLPDLIHEALWGISLWRRTQGRDGSIIGGVEYSLDGIAGSVSWNPIQRTFAYGPEEWAAYRFVMGAAKLGHVIASVCGDKVLGAALVAEAVAAWDWAEQQVAAGSANGDALAGAKIDSARIRASGVLYRASGHTGARDFFEAHNPFRPLSEKGRLGTRSDDFPYLCHDYVQAGLEGREVKAEITEAVTTWFAAKLDRGISIGSDYGLHATAQYPWGAGWYRFGPGSNWRAGEAAMDWLATNGNSDRIRDIVIEGLWFGLGCNPSNVSFVQGLGKRDFSDPLMIDLEGFCKVPGEISIGVAGGEMRDWEKAKLEGTLHPADQSVWPRYAQIFESRSAVLCAEHAMNANALEWLFASAFAVEVLNAA